MQGGFIQEIGESAAIRQGDVICRERRVPRHTGIPTFEFGVIVTADCDIAQEKMGPFFSYVSIVPASAYLENFWAYEELQKLRTRCVEVARTAIHEAEKRRDENVAVLTSRDLMAWLRRSTPQAIVDVVKISPERQKQTIQNLTVLSTIEDQSSEGSNLEKLKRCWDVQERNRANQKSTIESSLDQRQMRSEYIFVPRLPRTDDEGFVITLRDIRTVAVRDMYGGRLAWRLRADDDGMYRLGRFSDAFRYSIAQRLAFLFSRIGLSSAFETECKEVGQSIAKRFVP